eukprot:gene25107-biopygen1425
MCFWRDRTQIFPSTTGSPPWTSPSTLVETCVGHLFGIPKLDLRARLAKPARRARLAKPAGKPGKQGGQRKQGWTPLACCAPPMHQVRHVHSPLQVATGGRGKPGNAKKTPGKAPQRQGAGWTGTDGTDRERSGSLFQKTRRWVALQNSPWEGEGLYHGVRGKVLGCGECGCSHLRALTVPFERGAEDPDGRGRVVDWHPSPRFSDVILPSFAFHRRLNRVNAVRVGRACCGAMIKNKLLCLLF